MFIFNLLLLGFSPPKPVCHNDCGFEKHPTQVVIQLLPATRVRSAQQMSDLIIISRSCYSGMFIIVNPGEHGRGREWGGGHC